MFKSSVKHYSTTTSIKVPITLHGIDGRYATALFTAASKAKSLDKVEQELNLVSQVITKDVKLDTFLSTPLVDRALKREGVKSLLSKGKYSSITSNLFTVLAENGRLDQTKKIISAFNQLMTASRGEVSVKVTSATKLDEKTLSKIQSVLGKSNLVAKGSKLIVENKLDAQILGGLVIEVGDKTMDLSLSSKITKLNRLLTETI